MVSVTLHRRDFKFGLKQAKNFDSAEPRKLSVYILNVSAMYTN